MIEAQIRDENRLLCLITIQPGPDKNSLNIDLFLPREGKTLSGVMPAGGEAAQQVARAVMTLFPISALPTPELDEPEKSAYQVALEKRFQESVERENALHEGKPVDSSEEEQPTAWERFMQEEHRALNKRIAAFNEREKKLEQDIESFRKSQQATD